MPDSPDTSLRIRVLNPQQQPLGGTVDIQFVPHDGGQTLNATGADASKDIDVNGLQRAPQGLYQVTVTPTDVFKPSSQFVNVPPAGFTTVKFVIDKGTESAVQPPNAPPSDDGVCVRVRVLNPQHQPLGGTVDIEFVPHEAGQTVNVKGVDASHDIDVSGLQRTPIGLYQATVTPTDVFKPNSQFITVPASGFVVAEFTIDKGTQPSPSPPSATPNTQEPSMGEIMRWRLARSAQRRVPASESLLDLNNGSYVIGPPALQRIQGIAEKPSNENPDFTAYSRNLADVSALYQTLDSVSDAAAALTAMDKWLASKDNRPLLQDFDSEISNLLGQYLETPTWGQLHGQLSEYLYVYLVFLIHQPSADQINAVSLITRLLLVVGLVDARRSNNTFINTHDDVYAALRWRTLVLPDSITSQLQAIRAQNAVVVRKMGLADLYITREEWDHYEAAEIASIENILGGELKSRVHVLVNQTQVTTTTDVTTTSIKEQDTTTTDLTQLQQQATSDISIAAKVDGKVDTSGQYGPTQVNTHIGGSLDYSNATATSKATTQSHETVSRAVNRIEQTTRQIRTVSTLTKATDKEKHQFDNTKQTQPIIGIYRWVDQIQNVELDRYPHRLLAEFEIPEPGAWTRWLHQNDAANNMINKPPLPLTVTGLPNDPPLMPSDIGDATLPALVARYRVSGVTASPPAVLTLAVNLGNPASGTAVTNASSATIFQADSTVTVPSGYSAKNWQVGYIFEQGVGPGAFSLLLSVGSGEPTALTNSAGGANVGTTQGEVGPISQGPVPVSVVANGSAGFEINVQISCICLTETYAQWQNDTYALIVGAYNSMLQAYNDEKSSLTLQQTNLVNANSPDQNALTARQELKRQVIEMLMGTPFKGINAITIDPATGQPSNRLQVAAAYAPIIQFLEQAFEWETLSYICYPYYWADISRWGTLAAIQGNDQNFADFLRAGSARVMLAARPGFEDQVNFFTTFGIPWGGGPMPAPGDPEYLSIADEIKDQQQRPLDMTVIDSWQVRLPTTLIWLENPAGLPSNPSPTIQLIPSIASVSPSSGPIGTVVAITGSNFGNTQGNSTVTFNGTAATPTRWSMNLIQSSVPSGAKTGDVIVMVNGIPSVGATFSVS